MSIKSIRILALLPLMSLSGCFLKNIDCANTTYHFELPVKAYPDNQIIAINDTRWLSVDSPTEFVNLSDNLLTEFSNAANLGSGINFRALGPDNTFSIRAISHFDFILKEGVLLRQGYDEGSGNEYQFVERNNRYKFLLAIVPKFKGTYIVAFSNAANVSRRNDKCAKAGFTLNFRDTDQHYPLSPFYTPGQTLVGGAYYFIVQ